MSITDGFKQKLQEFAEGDTSTGDLMAAADHEDEHVLAACAVSSHHLKNGEFPKAANCLVNALRLVRSPLNIAQLRLQQAIAYHGHKHTSYAVTLLEQGLDALRHANDETSHSVRLELESFRRELTCAAA